MFNEEDHPKNAFFKIQRKKKKKCGLLKGEQEKRDIPFGSVCGLTAGQNEKKSG